MRINATLNVIIKSCVSLSYCRSGGIRSGYSPFFFLFFPPSEDPSLKNSHFPCLVAGIARHFERKVVMVFIDPRCPAPTPPPSTMPSAPSNSISKCCDSRAVQETKEVNIPQQLGSAFQQLAGAVVGGFTLRGRRVFCRWPSSR